LVTDEPQAAENQPKQNNDNRERYGKFSRHASPFTSSPIRSHRLTGKRERARNEVRQQLRH
jgi:hypothetical protein